jgi:hypothetical protein
MAETIIIEPGRLERNYWLDLWRPRELFRVLAWRDLVVRYKQTVIGVAWSVIRSLLTVFVFTVVFGRIAKLPSDGVPHPLVGAEGELALQLQRRDAVVGTGGHQIRRPEPGGERQLGVMHDGSGGDRGLATATSAHR